MNRPMRQFDADFATDGQKMIDLARAGEITRVAAMSKASVLEQWPNHRLEALYELAFLRIFIAWESFLESTFYRYMAGHESVVYGPASVIGSYRGIQAAENAVLKFHGSKKKPAPYIAWYQTHTVIKRCKAFIPSGRHHTVFVYNQPWLTDVAGIRHRIAHGQQHARAQFYAAASSLVGYSYPRCRPGKFLRSPDLSRPVKTTWLESIFMTLSGLASQIV